MKIGVVGVGHLGQHHTRIWQEIPNAELIGIYDTDKKRADEIAKKYNTQSIPNFSSFLENVDAVDIVTPTSSHFYYAYLSLNMNKHLFIEKPICSSLSDAEKLVKLATQKNLKIQVGHIERFNPAVMAVSKILLEPMFIESNRLAPFTPRGSDVPVVLDLMIHDIDIILSFIKHDVQDIKAVGIPVLTNSVDIANARIEFANGAVANVTASRISLKKLRKIRFFQADKYISLDYKTQEIKVIPKSDIMKFMRSIIDSNENLDIDKIVRSDALPIKQIEPLKAELQSFTDAVILDKRPLVNGEDGCKALKVANKIMKEIEKKLQNYNSSINKIKSSELQNK